MRQKVRRVVISCPPSVVRQWQEEMESRFGLTFMILDREFITARRQEWGYGINRSIKLTQNYQSLDTSGQR